MKSYTNFRICTFYIDYSQYSQFLLDTFLHEDKLYLMFEDANGAVVELANKKINRQLIQGL